MALQWPCPPGPAIQPHQVQLVLHAKLDGAIDLFPELARRGLDSSYIKKPYKPEKYIGETTRLWHFPCMGQVNRCVACLFKGLWPFQRSLHIRRRIPSNSNRVGFTVNLCESFLTDLDKLFLGGSGWDLQLWDLLDINGFQLLGNGKWW